MPSDPGPARRARRSGASGRADVGSVPTRRWPAGRGDARRCPRGRASTSSWMWTRPRCTRWASVVVTANCPQPVSSTRSRTRRRPSTRAAAPTRRGRASGSSREDDGEGEHDSGQSRGLRAGPTWRRARPPRRARRRGRDAARRRRSRCAPWSKPKSPSGQRRTSKTASTAWSAAAWATSSGSTAPASSSARASPVPSGDPSRRRPRAARRRPRLRSRPDGRTSDARPRSDERAPTDATVLERRPHPARTAPVPPAAHS